jgi:hypothetical protein
MSKRKVDMVEKLWAMLDGANAGEISGQCVADNLIDQSKLDKVLNNFEGTKGCNLEGKISCDSWIQFHRELSTILPNDDTFVGMIVKNWKGISEAGEAVVKIDSVMEIIKLMRQRLLTISNSN